MRLDEYTRIYELERSHWWYQTLHHIVFDAITRHAPPQPRVLDVGCGTGGLLSGLPPDARAVGCDLHPEALRLARSRSVRGVRADAAALPFAAGSADVVVSLDVLYHAKVKVPQQAVEEMTRVLKPGGILILNVPAYENLRSSHDIAVHTARRFTRAEVRKLLLTTGLEPLVLTHWNTLLFPAIAAMRLSRKRHTDSDLRPPNPWLNQSVAALLGLERRWIRHMPLPFGLSIFAAARKPAQRVVGAAGTDVL